MADFELQRVALPTGVELDVAVAGHPTNPAIILLHGFPESHRTWRNQITALAADHFVLAPDQRGFARSSKPEGVENYTADKPVADMYELNEAVMCRRKATGKFAWNWNVGLAAPKIPPRTAGCD